MVEAERNEVEDREGLDSLLEFLKRTRGFDFSGYKRPSLARRIRKRMAAIGVPSYADYEDYLQVHPDEFTDLFDTILINVTGFFRDPPAWKYLAEEIIPRVIEGGSGGRPIRVWSAACASGEEAYTAAMLLAEALGDDVFRRRVKIYATDIDEDALTTARHASYPADAVSAIPEELRLRYFERAVTGYVFRPDLRRSVIFGRNDLVQDAPISRTDLLISRNALMYFTPETQARILRHFNFSLNESGFLFLGKSEMLITHSDLFNPYSLKWRVFTKVTRIGVRERFAFADYAIRVGAEDETPHRAQLRDAAYEAVPVAQVVIDRGGILAGANLSARAMFGFTPADVGRPFQDLELSYRPVDLRTALNEAYEQQRAVELGRVQWQRGGAEPRTYEVSVTPLLDDDSGVLGASVTFTDVTTLARVDDQFTASKRQLETAYEELQSTVEELETTNEELQSTNEELETTNEELQSTNEELETMNEELQSTNDELETMNEDQRVRSAELDRVNLFLEGILGNLGVGVVVLDPEQRVQLWNDFAFELWGLREEEVHGKHFLALDTGLPVERLKDAVDDALAEPPEESELELEAVNRRGRKFNCHVRVKPLPTSGGQRFGAIVMMSDASVDGAERVHASSA